ncbi:SDR family oxidoreductase [Aliikangiella sp. G2MR2-5]|uniref:SDR family oxidoreductase n=1 Tax=Aliikangiella sp. G2MR2-5 TaxID=2788943 RepID=UPI0018A8A168|nr:SDR family oxidoreductase [Aliikangiella sp. G2MR2-5]
MTKSNTNRVAVITGASSGFGYATAVKLVEQGWYVIALARRLNRLEELKTLLGESNCEIHQLDVTDGKQVETFENYLLMNQINVHLLVNNAGLALGLEPAHKASLDDWEVMIETNIKGLIKMTRALLPAMVEAKSGHIINLGSIAGTYAYPGGNTYGASKAFVAQFSMNLRADLAGTGIRVTNIEPGLAETEFSVVRFHGDKEKADNVYQGLEPLTAEDIAESIVWAASQPAHVNINRIELMPTCQSFSPLAITK